MEPAQKKARLFMVNDPAFSDLKLEFGGEIRRVHKVILCQKSGWFATALTSNFTEASSSTISLTDDDPEILNVVLDFCYSDEPRQIISNCIAAKPAAFRARLYQTADKYDVPSLQSRIEAWFTGRGEQAFKNGDQEETLKLLYMMPDSAASRIRALVLSILRPQLCKMNTKKSFKNLVTSHPQLAADILVLLGEDVPEMPLTHWRCSDPACNRTFSICSTEPIEKQGQASSKQANRLVLKWCPFCRTNLQRPSRSFI